MAALGTALALAAGGASPEDGDFARLGEPRPGEWRAVFDEPEQTFEEYKTLAGKAPPPEGRRMQLVPLGEAREGDEKRFKALKRFLAAYFQTRVDLEKRRPISEHCKRRPSRGFGTQVLADHVLRLISRRVPKDVIARAGVTGEDLFATSRPGRYFNFVFGVGSAGLRTGVYSYARYSQSYPGRPEDITPLKRLAKVAGHEIGHMLGMAHCLTYECCVNGSNSLQESDSRPIHLCPLCLRKLGWHLGLDLEKRYRALAAVYNELGWKKEAAFALRRAEKVSHHGGTEARR